MAARQKTTAKAPKSVKAIAAKPKQKTTKPKPTAVAARGRPKRLEPEARREKILTAAQGIFLAAGYQSASMDAVAQAAGMSKKTLYQVFATKQALFEATMMAQADTITSVIGPESDNRPVLEVLTEFLSHAQNLITTPERVALLRVTAAEAPREPGLARAVFKRMDTTKAEITRWFRRLEAQGNLKVDDPELAGSMLIGMVLGDLHLRLLLGGKRPSAAQMKQRVDFIAQNFVKLYKLR